MNDFIPFNGGKNPCHPKDIVKVTVRNGKTSSFSLESEKFYWGHSGLGPDIVAYQIVESNYSREQKLFEETFPNLFHDKTPSGMYSDEKTQYVWDGWRARFELIK